MAFVQVGIPAKKVVDLAIEKGTPGHTPCMEADRALARRSGEEPSAHMLTGEEPGAICETEKMAGAVEGPRQVDKGGNSVEYRPDGSAFNYRERMPPALRLVVSRCERIAKPQRRPQASAVRSHLMIVR